MMDYTERDSKGELRRGYPPIREVTPGVFEIAPGILTHRVPGHGLDCACEDCFHAQPPAPPPPERADVLSRILGALVRIERLLQEQPRPQWQKPKDSPPEQPGPLDV